MKACRWFGSLLVLAGLFAFVGPKFPAQAGAKGDTKFEWKAFDPDGKTFYQTLKTETEQTMKVMGMDVIQKQNQTFYISWTPQKKDDKGNWVVSQKIVGVKMDIDIGGNKISYDSTTEQPNNPMTDFFKALLTLDLKFTIDPKSMKIEKIEGNEEFIKNLGKTNPQMEPLLKSILSKDALMKMAEPTLFAFPTTAVKKGGDWKKTSNLDLGPIGSYKTDYTFTYEGQDKSLDKIAIKAAMTYAPPMDKGKLPFTIESGSELSGSDGKGSALFNPKLGRFDEYNMTMNLKGNLKIDIGGMKTTVELEQKQNATVTTSNDNPVAEKKKASK